MSYLNVSASTPSSMSQPRPTGTSAAAVEGGLIRRQQQPSQTVGNDRNNILGNSVSGLSGQAFGSNGAGTNQRSSPHSASSFAAIGANGPPISIPSASEMFAGTKFGQLLSSGASDATTAGGGGFAAAGFSVQGVHGGSSTSVSPSVNNNRIGGIGSSTLVHHQSISGSNLLGGSGGGGGGSSMMMSRSQQEQQQQHQQQYATLGGETYLVSSTNADGGVGGSQSMMMSSAYPTNGGGTRRDSVLGDALGNSSSLQTVYLAPVVAGGSGGGMYDSQQQFIVTNPPPPSSNQQQQQQQSYHGTGPMNGSQHQQQRHLFAHHQQPHHTTSATNGGGGGGGGMGVLIPIPGSSSVGNIHNVSGGGGGGFGSSDMQPGGGGFFGGTPSISGRLQISSNYDPSDAEEGTPKSTPSDLSRHHHHHQNTSGHSALMGGSSRLPSMPMYPTSLNQDGDVTSRTSSISPATLTLNGSGQSSTWGVAAGSAHHQPLQQQQQQQLFVAPHQYTGGPSPLVVAAGGSNINGGGLPRHPLDTSSTSNSNSTNNGESRRLSNSNNPPSTMGTPASFRQQQQPPSAATSQNVFSTAMYHNQQFTTSGNNNNNTGIKAPPSPSLGYMPFSPYPPSHPQQQQHRSSIDNGLANSNSPAAAAEGDRKKNAKRLSVSARNVAYAGVRGLLGEEEGYSSDVTTSSSNDDDVSSVSTASEGQEDEVLAMTAVGGRRVDDGGNEGFSVTSGLPQSHLSSPTPTRGGGANSASGSRVVTPQSPANLPGSRRDSRDVRPHSTSTTTPINNSDSGSGVLPIKRKSLAGGGGGVDIPTPAQHQATATKQQGVSPHREFIPLQQHQHQYQHQQQITPHSNWAAGPSHMPPPMQHQQQLPPPHQKNPSQQQQQHQQGGSRANTNNNGGGDHKHIDPTNNLFVCYLPPSVDDEGLLNLANSFSHTAISAKVARHPDNNLTRGFGFVLFNTIKEATAVRDKLDGYSFAAEGKKLVVRYAPPVGGEDPDGDSNVAENRNIYVKGIPPQWQNDDLQEFFESRFGKVEDSIVLMHRGQSKCLGLVRFESIESAKAAVKECHGKAVVPNWAPPLQVRYSVPEKTRRKGGKEDPVVPDQRGRGGGGRGRGGGRGGLVAGSTFTDPVSSNSNAYPQHNHQQQPYRRGGMGASNNAPPPFNNNQQYHQHEQQQQQQPHWQQQQHPQQQGGVFNTTNNNTGSSSYHQQQQPFGDAPQRYAQPPPSQQQHQYYQQQDCRSNYADGNSYAPNTSTHNNAPRQTAPSGSTRSHTVNNPYTATPVPATIKPPHTCRYCENGRGSVVIYNAELSGGWEGVVNRLASSYGQVFNCEEIPKNHPRAAMTLIVVFMNMRAASAAVRELANSEHGARLLECEPNQ